MVLEHNGAWLIIKIQPQSLGVEKYSCCTCRHHTFTCSFLTYIHVNIHVHERNHSTILSLQNYIVCGDANFAMSSTQLTIGGFMQPGVARGLWLVKSISFFAAVPAEVSFA